MTTLNIGIANYGQMKERTLALARGEYRPAKGEPTVWFTSIGSFAKVLSERNRELLTLIAQEKPNSLSELALLSGRNKSNLSRTLKTMARHGLVELEKGHRGKLIPQVPYDQVRLDVSLTSCRPAAVIAAND
ncbi:MAG: helix-turn-helix domain-containing protein [Chloroflexi bacterium]|nr:helix-turn-helix domain-containing protein [Chloroflexota bacterium]